MYLLPGATSGHLMVTEPLLRSKFEANGCSGEDNFVGLTISGDKGGEKEAELTDIQMLGLASIFEVAQEQRALGIRGFYRNLADPFESIESRNGISDLKPRVRRNRAHHVTTTSEAGFQTVSWLGLVIFGL